MQINCFQTRSVVVCLPFFALLLRNRKQVATLMQKQNSLTFHWLFPDQIQFFTDQNTAVLRPICLLAADKWQIPFTSSLKCTCLILQREASVRLKKSTLFRISSSQNTCYNTYFGPKLCNFLTFPWLSWYLKFPWLICKIPWLFPDLEEKSNFPDFSLRKFSKWISFLNRGYALNWLAGVYEAS